MIDRETVDPDILPAQDALALLQGLLAGWFGRSPIKIYEAGGGSISYLPSALIESADITVVDIDDDQLRNNEYARAKIRGDIQTCDFSGQNFDLVVCNYVIEHIERPDKALINFASAVAPNGLVVIAAPNPHSFTGAITKYTPHWFSRLVLSRGARKQVLPAGPAPRRSGRFITPLFRRISSSNSASATDTGWSTSRCSSCAAWQIAATAPGAGQDPARLYPDTGICFTIAASPWRFSPGP